MRRWIDKLIDRIIARIAAAVVIEQQRQAAAKEAGLDRARLCGICYVNKWGEAFETLDGIGVEPSHAEKCFWEAERRLQ